MGFGLVRLQALERIVFMFRTVLRLSTGLRVFGFKDLGFLGINPKPETLDSRAWVFSEVLRVLG